MKSFEYRRKILLAQMLPHTCIGHPISAWLSLLGYTTIANSFHYFTLPRRAKKHMKIPPRFNLDPRLRLMDIVFTPICSLLRAIGCYWAADKVFRLGPHKIAGALGACGYYYPKEDRYKNKDEELDTSKESGIELTLISAGFTKSTTSIWEWIPPIDWVPNKQDLLLIDLSGHALAFKRVS